MGDIAKVHSELCHLQEKLEKQLPIVSISAMTVSELAVCDIMSIVWYIVRYSWFYLCAGNSSIILFVISFPTWIAKYTEVVLGRLQISKAGYF